VDSLKSLPDRRIIPVSNTSWLSIQEADRYARYDIHGFRDIDNEHRRRSAWDSSIRIGDLFDNSARVLKGQAAIFQQQDSPRRSAMSGLPGRWRRTLKARCLFITSIFHRFLSLASWKEFEDGLEYTTSLFFWVCALVLFFVWKKSHCSVHCFGCFGFEAFVRCIFAVRRYAGRRWSQRPTSRVIVNLLCMDTIL